MDFVTRNNVNLIEIIFCPKCSNDLEIKNNSLGCKKCKLNYPLINNVPILFDKDFSKDIAGDNITFNSWEDKDIENKTFKVAQHSSNKKSLYQLITPNYRYQLGPRYMDFIKKYNIQGKILELGGGPNALNHPGLVNCDINNYETVDVVGDGRKLPFKDNSFDGIICNSVLEHIFEYDEVINECFRVLKKNGLIFMNVPQLCARHHTYDYHRWTIVGLEKDLSKFRIIDKGIILGPGMFIHHFVTAFFKSLTPFKLINLSICFILEWLFFIFRFLDFFGKKNKDYEDFAHTIYVVGKK